MIRRPLWLFAALLALCLCPSPARAEQRWLVVSDMHVDPFNRDTVPASYGDDSNWTLFQSAVAAMRRTNPNPAAVVIGGDFLAHHFGNLTSSSGANQSTARASLSVMRRVAKAFAAAFPLAPFYVVVGNNDDPCGDYRSTPGTAYMRELARIWAPLVNRNGNAPDFERTFAAGGYYVAKTPERGLRLIALNDVYWSFVYRDACGRLGSDPGAAEFAWFEKVLAATPSAVHNVVLMHIPPGVDARSTLSVKRFLIVPFLNTGANSRLLRDLANPDARVAFAIAAHMHRADFRLDDRTPIFLAPAVSPVYHNNPSFAQIDIGDDGALLDYTIYAYDEESGSWSDSFDFDRAYGVRSLDADSLLDVHRAIEQDPRTRFMWGQSQIGGYTDERGVNRVTWRSYWCAQTELGSSFASCAGARKRVTATAIAFVAAAVVAVALLGVVFYRVLWRRRRKSA